MKKIFFTLTLLLATWSVYGQAVLPLSFTPKSTSSGHATMYGMGDTVYSQVINVSSYDSLIPVIVTNDSVMVAVTYMNYDALAQGSWATNDTIKGYTDGGTTAPFGNIAKAGASTLIKNTSGQYIKLRYHFVSPSPYTGQTRKTFKSWLKVYKH